MRPLVFVVLIAACNKTESVATTTTPTPSAASSVAAAPSASVASVVDSGLTLEQEIASLTDRWNAALARRDADALGDVYGEHVTMYGASYTRASAIAAKKTAFTPDYTQSIASVMFLTHDAARPGAVFDKTWTSRGKHSSVRGSLAFAKENGKWVITEETDGKTEQMLSDNSCLGLVYAAILSTDDAKVFSNTSYGMMYVCGPPECDAFQIAAIQIGHDLQRLATFDVDQKKGVVSHAGLELKADPAIIARLKVACAREEARASGAP